MREDFERLAFARSRTGARWHEVITAHARLGDARIGKRHGALRLLRRLLRPNTRLDLGDTRDLAVSFLREHADLIRRYIARYDQNGIIGRVEAPIERKRVFTIELLDFMAPADDWPAIGMVEIKR